jgi:DNA-binding transcriptional MerR regulator
VDYRIDDLAQAAGTTVRNIRAYQDRGLLPPPRREGRVGWYSDDHLARLRIIGALLERGYSLGNIAELLATWEGGGDLRELLGLEAALTNPFSDETPSFLDPGELADLFGTIDPAAIARAIQLGILIPDGPRFRVPSMRLLRAGAELFHAGIPLLALLDEIAALRSLVDQVASRFVALAQLHIFDRFGDAMPPPGEAARLAQLVLRVRPLAKQVVDTELSRALEIHIRAGMGDRLGRLLERKKKRLPPGKS